MRGDYLIYTLAVGIAVVCFVLATLAGHVGQGRGFRVIVPLAGAAAVGLAWWWLINHPGQIESFLPRFIDRRVWLILAAVAFLLLLRRRR